MGTATALARETKTYPHIVKTPGVRGGKARIDGTRICVKDIVALHDQGMQPERMLEYYDSRPLTLAEVYAALAYYHDHAEENDAEFAAAEEAEAAHERKRTERPAHHAGR